MLIKGESASYKPVDCKPKICKLWVASLPICELYAAINQSVNCKVWINHQSASSKSLDMFQVPTWGKTKAIRQI